MGQIEGETNGIDQRFVPGWKHLMSNDGLYHNESADSRADYGDRRTNEALCQHVRVVVFCSVFTALLVFGIVFVEPSQFSSRIRNSSTDPLSARRPVDDEMRNCVHVVTGLSDWQSTIATGRCVLFVDCNWNADVVAFRPKFWEFAYWCRNQSDYEPISVIVDPDMHDGTTLALQQLWDSNRISPGGLKNLGGAGRIVWFEDGRIVDYAWCSQLAGTLHLEERSRRTFD